MKIQLLFLFSIACVLAAPADDKEKAAEKVCEPSKEFTKDCSVCTCNASGSEFTCQKKACPETEKVAEVEPVKEEKCTPGELYKVKCNECKCPDSGLKAQASCTIIGCPDE